MRCGWNGAGGWMTGTTSAIKTESYLRAPVKTSADIEVERVRCITGFKTID